MADEDPPSAAVLRAFGLAAPPTRLEGGRGRSWRAGEVVVKPLDGSPASLGWQADHLGALRSDEVRIAAPLRATDGRVVVDGWIATPFLEGRHGDRRWREAIAAGRAFHRATAGLDRPDFLEARDDPWAVGDRVAWGESPALPFADHPHVRRLLALVEPVGDLPEQVIHGDLGGNVLLAAGLPPAIIDISPYWRPAGFGIAIIVADALVWEGAEDSLLDAVVDVPHFPQLLVRALIYRLVTDAVFASLDPDREDATAAHAGAVELAVALCARR
jgi:uncharacterized protein (TIGR02569 family)